MNPSIYYPETHHQWIKKHPNEVGMEASFLQEAIDFSVSNESPWSRTMKVALTHLIAKQSHNEIMGPIKDRAGVNGIVLRHGYVIAEWGDTHRVDMAYSISKSFLSAIAGAAYDCHLLEDPNRLVNTDLPEDPLVHSMNPQITWHHLLQQTSEWEGNLWGKPDFAGRTQGSKRALQSPGTFWEYNDVRVNLLALKLLQLWKKPLPEVLRDSILNPIEASDTWEWHGYENSWCLIQGKTMHSVSGGGHWGGGVWINSWDLARLGYLYLRQGKWKQRQVLSKQWLDWTLTPCQRLSAYGYLWWLNTNGELLPDAPHSSFMARGGNTNLVYVDTQHDLVVVIRWIDRPQLNGFIKRVLRSIV